MSKEDLAHEQKMFQEEDLEYKPVHKMHYLLIQGVFLAQIFTHYRGKGVQGGAIKITPSDPLKKEDFQNDTFWSFGLLGMPRRYFWDSGVAGKSDSSSHIAALGAKRSNFRSKKCVLK